MSWAFPFDAVLAWRITLTLVHVTWIGLVLAWLARITNRRLRQASPNWRFGVNLVALLLFCLAVPITFAIVRWMVTLTDHGAELQADDPPDANQRFIAELPDGTIVELIAVGFNPSDGRPWWKPNGATLPEPPRERSGRKSSIMAGSPREAECREFCVRILGLGNNESSLQFRSAVGSISGGSWKPPAMILDAAAGHFNNQKATSISVALTGGDWGPWQVISRSGNFQDIGPLAEEFREVYGRVNLQKVTATDVETSLLLRLDNPLYLDATMEVFAVGLDGGRHHAPKTSTTLDTSEYIFDLPREKIDHFEYRLRPYRQRVTFENVSLEPQQNSKVVIRTVSNVPSRPYLHNVLVEERKVVFKGKTDPSHETVIRINKDGKPLEWRQGASLGELEVTVEASDKISLENGKLGHGFVLTVKHRDGTGVTRVSLTEPAPVAGTFVIRGVADFLTKEGIHTFADVVFRDGKKLPVTVSFEAKSGGSLKASGNPRQN